MYIRYTIHIEVIYNGWMVYLHWKWTHIAIVLDQSSGSGGEGCPVLVGFMFLMASTMTHRYTYNSHNDIDTHI